MTIGLISKNGTLVKDRKLNIGAGDEKYEGWETLDVSPVYSPNYQHDLTVFPWPFEDGAFAEIAARHVLEHIERQKLIPVMNEMHRILSPGGVAHIEVPIFPYWMAIADPTHVSFFVPQTFSYFVTFDSYTKAMHGAPTFDNEHHRALYGILEWKMRKAYRNEQGSIIAVELVKP